ncbi:MAG TPA: hypothetical protein VJT15_01565 [Pyrinomonadaceae bacterium]|nr:hypothetical protein [Pyrinomonadaceae bacterium]
MGAWSEPDRGVIRYDRQGRCLTPHIDPGSGWRQYGLPLPPLMAAPSQRYETVRKRANGTGWKTVWLFDKAGRLERFEAYALYEHGPSLANWHQYSYDSQGRVEELTYWADWGRHPNQTEPYPPVRLKYWFDSAGRIGGWTKGNDPKSRSSLTYDEKGLLVKQVDEDVDGNITYITTQTWEGYDQQSNWTVHTFTQTWRTKDGDEPHDKTVTRRSLKYGRRST